MTPQRRAKAPKSGLKGPRENWMVFKLASCCWEKQNCSLSALEYMEKPYVTPVATAAYMQPMRARRPRAVLVREPSETQYMRCGFDGGCLACAERERLFDGGVRRFRTSSGPGNPSSVDELSFSREKRKSGDGVRELGLRLGERLEGREG